MRLALLAVLVAIVVVYAADAAGPWPVGVALASRAVLGGVGAPALQNHIEGLSPTRRGALLALGMSALNLGVAASSGIAGHAYALCAPWVAGLGVLLLSAAVFALRPAARREKCAA